MIKTEPRTDYAGSYIAYIYSDGHTETDPPGRPMSREDVQRQRLQEVSRLKAREMAQAQRSRHGVVSSIAPAVTRETGHSIVPRVLVQSFHETLDAIAALAPTARTNEGMLAEASGRYALGGELVGDRAGTREEYTQTKPAVIPGQTIREPQYQMEG
jgi:hypothetical protein